MRHLLAVVKGMVIGLANVIPGVSGGTMMVSMGIYDTIIECITKFLKQWKKSLVTLLPYAAGMLLGIVAASFSIELLFEWFPLPTALLFIGLIFGGVPMLLKKAEATAPRPLHIVLFVVFFALVVSLQLAGESAGLERSFSLTFGSLVVAFLLGVVASATMVIPGVSGSMVMMILGYYTAILGLINTFVKALTGGDVKAALESVGILLPFGIGVLVGIFGVAKLIEYLMNRHRRATYSAILGLVVASPFPVFRNAGIASIGAGAAAFGIVTFAAGFAAALWLGKE